MTSSERAVYTQAKMLPMATITVPEVFAGPIKFRPELAEDDCALIHDYIYGRVNDWLDHYRSYIENVGKIQQSTEHTEDDKNMATMMLFKRLSRELEHYCKKICIRRLLLLNDDEGLADMREECDEEGDLFEFESQLEHELNTPTDWTPKLKERPDLHVTTYECFQSYMAKLYATCRGNLVQMRHIVYKGRLL